MKNAGMAATTDLKSDDPPFTGNEVLGPVTVQVVTVRALEGADVRVGDERISALPRHFLTHLHRESLQTGFAFDQPD